MNTHIWVANCRFGTVELPHCHWVAHVILRAEMASILVSAVCVDQAEVHLFIRTSSMSADSSRCQFGTKSIRACGLDEALPGVFPSQPSPVYAQETQLPAASLLGHRREVC